VENFSHELIILFSLFTYFSFYTKKWSKEFQGASQLIGLIVDWSMIIFTVYGLGFLIYQGYQFGVINALKLWGIAWGISIGLMVVETVLFGRIRYLVAYLGMISILACPILAVAIWFV